MMKLTILGSCSAYPTLDRFTTSQILQINGKSFLIDCGEGTQIQLRNNKIKFKYSLKKKTVSYNRNIAIKFAKNAFDLILYIDSDVIPEKNILSSHVKNHKKNKHTSSRRSRS